MILRHLAQDRLSLSVRAAGGLPKGAAETWRRSSGPSECKAGERLANRPGTGREGAGARCHKRAILRAEEFCNWLNLLASQQGSLLPSFDMPEKFPVAKIPLILR